MDRFGDFKVGMAS